MLQSLDRRVAADQGGRTRPPRLSPNEPRQRDSSTRSWSCLHEQPGVPIQGGEIDRRTDVDPSEKGVRFPHRTSRNVSSAKRSEHEGHLRSLALVLSFAMVTWPRPDKGTNNRRRSSPKKRRCTKSARGSIDSELDEKDEGYREGASPNLSGEAGQGEKPIRSTCPRRWKDSTPGFASRTPARSSSTRTTTPAATSTPTSFSCRRRRRRIPDHHDYLRLQLEKPAPSICASGRSDSEAFPMPHESWSGSPSHRFGPADPGAGSVASRRTKGCMSSTGRRSTCWCCGRCSAMRRKVGHRVALGVDPFDLARRVDRLLTEMAAEHPVAFDRRRHHSSPGEDRRGLSEMGLPRPGRAAAAKAERRHWSWATITWVPSTSSWR